MTIKILSSSLQGDEDAVYISDDGVDVDLISVRIADVVKTVPLLDFMPAILAFDTKRSMYYEANPID